jgi:hypothetical protein
VIWKNGHTFAAACTLVLTALPCRTRRSGISAMLAALLLCGSGSQSAAQTFTTVLNFDGTDGANSAAGLIRDTDGNFYGTTSEGASTVMARSSGSAQTVH